MRTPHLLISAALLVLSAGSSGAASQQPAYLFVHDYCVFYASGAIECSIHIATADGDLYVADGMDPSWSPDGSRIAFAGLDQSGIYAVNLADWSVVTIRTSGGAPAWSPDGSTLAFSDGGINVMRADGSDVVLLTSSAPFGAEPAWSPDGQTIVFECYFEPGNVDICTIRADGTGLARLTTDPAWASGPVFSPDGSKIWFTTSGTDPSLSPQYLAVMNADGTGMEVSDYFGMHPAWSADGTHDAVVGQPNGDGCSADRQCPTIISTSNGMWVYGSHPSWGVSPRPVAWIESDWCDGLVCGFDASQSWGGDGGIASYTWDFGDGTTADGPAATHTYPARGTYVVTLTVSDAAGVTATRTATVRAWNATPTASFIVACSAMRCTFDASRSSDPDGEIAAYVWLFGDYTTAETSTPNVTHTYTRAGTFTAVLRIMDNEGAFDYEQQAVTIVNVLPVAAFTFACSGLTCAVDAAGSYDSDGAISGYAWSFGDATAGSGVSATHTYGAAGTYSVTLTVTDNSGAVSTESHTVTVAAELHVGDLNGESTSEKNAWTAKVIAVVHDASHQNVADVVISGTWSDGTPSSCTTNVDGRCEVSRSGILKKTNTISFTVTSVARATLVYTPAANHDPGGDSTGTTVAVTRP